MFEMLPARFARRFCAVVMSDAFKPRKFVAVMFCTGIVPTPSVALGLVVCWPPWLNPCEPVKSMEKPAWYECAPFVKLMVSANCLNGLIDCRGDATPNGA